MTEKEPPSFDSLDAKLKAARKANKGPGEASGPSQQGAESGLGFGSRLSVEIITSLLAGLGLGWVIDHFAGTQHLFMLIFMFLGLGLGVYHVMVLSRRMQQEEENKQQ